MKNKFTLAKFSKFKSKKDLIQTIYLSSIIDSYSRVRMIRGIKLLTENQIRDEIVYDLKYKNLIISKWLNWGLIKISFEDQNLLPNHSKNRTDISFFISGLEFIIECKKLTFADNRYIIDGLKRYFDLYYAENYIYGGMAGFIVAGSVADVIKDLKVKVKNYKSSVSFDYLLGRKVLGFNDSFQSKLTRKNRSNFHVFHIFYDLI